MAVTNYTPRKGDAMFHQGEALVVTGVDGGMVEFKGSTVSGRINVYTWAGMWSEATDRRRGPSNPS